MTAANEARDNRAFPRPAASVLAGELSLEGNSQPLRPEEPRSGVSKDAPMSANSNWIILRDAAHSPGPQDEVHGSAVQRPRLGVTIEDILAGPVVRAMMSADRVDAEALAAMLRSVALKLRKRARDSSPVSRPSAPTCPTGAEIPAV